MTTKNPWVILWFLAGVISAMFIFFNTLKRDTTRPVVLLLESPPPGDSSWSFEPNLDTVYGLNGFYVYDSTNVKLLVIPPERKWMCSPYDGQTKW